MDYLNIYLPALLVTILITIGAGIILLSQFTVVPIIIRNIILIFIIYCSVLTSRLTLWGKMKIQKIF